MRESFYYKWSWWLLLLTFALTFFASDRSDAKNLYRVLVALPVLLMSSGQVAEGLFSVKPMRWFAAISIYFSITLLWGSEYKLFDNHLLRIASVWAFACLLYYISYYRPELFLQIDKVLVFFGLIWIVLVAYEINSLWHDNIFTIPGLVKRGVFSHHLQVGWMVAILTLISFQRALRKNSQRFFWVVITAIFFTALIFVQARGGYLVFLVGLITYLFANFSRLNWRFVLATCVGLFFVVFGVFFFYHEIFNSLISRGAASRFVIWGNWLSLWQVSSVKMIFGYGLGASLENLAGNVTAAHFHNLYLNTLYYCGVIGFTLFLGWVLSIVTLVFKRNTLNSHWLPIIVGMLAGFLTDGDKLFNYPGAFVFCFILPVFCLSFEAEFLYRSHGACEDFTGTR